MTREEFDALIGELVEPSGTVATRLGDNHSNCTITDTQAGITASDSSETNVARFSGASWIETIRQMSVCIFGCGGIGSWAALAVARFRPVSIVVYDMDTVERVNMAGQLFAAKHIGMSKVGAVADTINAFAQYNISAYDVRVDGSTPTSRITICGFDNMEARKVAFNNWKAAWKGESTALFIDGRMSADTIQIYAITGDDEYGMQKYAEEALFDDSVAETTLCSMKQTTYVAMIMGGMIANKLVEFANSTIGLPVTYYTEYNAMTMTIKQQ